MTEANANDEKTGEKEDFSLGHSGGVASEELPPVTCWKQRGQSHVSAEHMY